MASPKKDSASSEPRTRRFGRKRRQKDPDNPGRIAQVKQVFKVTRQNDPALVWWMALAALLVMLVALIIGFAVDQVVYVTVLGVPLAVLAMVVVLGRRAEAAAYRSIEGQPGATGAVLGSLRRGWYYDKEPIAAETGGRSRGTRDLHNAAMVFRAVGKPGVVLIAEGPKGPSQRLAQAEKKRATRVAGDAVPVHVLRLGHGENEVPLGKLAKRMKRLDKKLSKQEAVAVHQRLKALGGMRPPIPKGVDPRKARMDRKALRGR